MLDTTTYSHLKDPNIEPPNSSIYDTQARPYCPQDFISFPMGTSVQLPYGTSLSNEEIPYPDMAGIPLFSDTVQWEWDLQNLWNGYFMPEN
jgi:hypothetical protein